MGTRVDFGSFLRVFGVPLWGHFCSIGVIIFVIRGFGAPKYKYFWDVCFKVTFLDDFWSDYGVSGTLKTSIWHESGCKNNYFVEMCFVTILGSI